MKPTITRQTMIDYLNQEANFMKKYHEGNNPPMYGSDGHTVLEVVEAIKDLVQNAKIEPQMSLDL